eukprot:gb/GECG01002828.1/.p1 GENE.gb/GECG01002828.1/~~gb/GECG01002828.1/.p1  ORF type:complete len:420 (+),score=36.85 gb/GECG01002828.1/:1-1260(+)
MLTTRSRHALLRGALFSRQFTHPGFGLAQYTYDSQYGPLAAAAAAAFVGFAGYEMVSAEPGKEEDFVITQRPGFSNALSFPYSPVYKDPEGRPLKLVHVIAITRHGDRTPIGSTMGNYGRDLETIDQEWNKRLTKKATERRLQQWCPRAGAQQVCSMDHPESCRGKLTEVGIAQLEQVGKHLREVYATDKYYSQPLLPHHCDPSKIEARSTNFKRCIESMQSLLLGLYPPSTRGADYDSESAFEDEESIPGISERSSLHKSPREVALTPVHIRAGGINAEGNENSSDVETLFPHSAGPCPRLDKSFSKSRQLLKEEVHRILQEFRSGDHEIPHRLGKRSTNLGLGQEELQRCLRCRQSAKYVWKAFGLETSTEASHTPVNNKGEEEMIPWIRVRDILLAHFTHGINMGLVSGRYEIYWD